MKNIHGGNISLYKELLGDKEKILDFSSNINPKGLPTTAKEVLKNIENYINIYPDIDYKNLRKSISDYTKVDYNNIQVGCGATELIHNLIKTLSPKKALNILPAYSEYKVELQKINCQIVEYYLEEKNDFQINDDDLKIYTDIDMVIFCNPNNPTGTFIEKDHLFKLLTFYKEKGIMVLVDETYAEFSRKQSALSLIDTFDNLFVIRGTSKFFALSGLRLGYLLTSNKIVLTNIKKIALPWTVNTIAEKIGETVFSDKKFIEDTIKNTEEAVTYFKNVIEKIPSLKVFNTNSNLFIVKILSDKKATDFANFCLKNNVIIRDLTYYGFKEDGQCFFRISPLNQEDNEVLGKLLEDYFNR